MGRLITADVPQLPRGQKLSINVKEKDRHVAVSNGETCM